MFANLQKKSSSALHLYEKMRWIILPPPLYDDDADINKYKKKISKAELKKRTRREGNEIYNTKLKQVWTS